MRGYFAGTGTGFAQATFFKKLVCTIFSWPALLSCQADLIHSFDIDLSGPIHNKNSPQSLAAIADDY
jgi:hypothetical protein